MSSNPHMTMYGFKNAFSPQNVSLMIGVVLDHAQAQSHSQALALHKSLGMESGNEAN